MVAVTAQGLVGLPAKCDETLNPRSTPGVDLRYPSFMSEPKGFKVRMLGGAILALALTACIVVPDQRHYAGGVVMVAPPPAREEVIGVPPTAGYVWIGGYWSWVGTRHEWVGGHWEAPRAGRVWVPHQWVRQGDGWALRPGHWQRARY